ncbi:MAG: DUF1254 domain-containing protein [Acidovorax sp.]
MPLVTVENFTRAETDYYFAQRAQVAGLGRFGHLRELTPVDHQRVIRMNRDTLYSSAVFDLDAGPATITLPDAGARYLSLHLLNQDHYTTAIHHGAGAYTLSRDSMGTRYAYAVVRTFVDLGSTDDLRQAHALQDAIQVRQDAPGRMEVPDWDETSRHKVRNAVLALGATLENFDRTFGARHEVDPIRHLIGTAYGWGGLPEREAIYRNFSPALADGQTVHRLTLKDVPVDGFWSVSVYNAAGYFEPNPAGVYTLNNLTAKQDGDGTVTLQFGGSADHAANHLPIMPGWNYIVRLYQPRAEVLSGAWKLPEAQPA